MTPDDTLAAELDELNAAVRVAPDGDTSAQMALWQRVSRLERWFFINRGSAEQPRPFAVAAEQGPMVCLYSSGARADEAGRALGLVGADDSVEVLALPMPRAIDYLTSFGQSGVVAVTLDHPRIGHFIPLANLGAVKRWAGKHRVPDEPVDLVRIGPDDWRELRDVRLASLADAPAAFGSRYDDWVDADEQRWRDRLAAVPLTVVARSEAATVGVVCGASAEDAVELISMWVAPGHRGTGLADRLIHEVIAWAEVRPTVLMVRDDNPAAIGAYARSGFVDEGVPDDWPTDAPPERRMRHAAVC